MKRPNCIEQLEQGVLNLIPKQDKDTRILKNLRPITLLNVDYKVIEKVIANRFKSILDHLIHIDQKGFMENRKITSNIRKMCDLITYAEINDLEARCHLTRFSQGF